MTSLAPRFLFRIHNRRGLGHLMRSTVLARELLSLAPQSAIQFYCRSRPPESFRDARIEYLQALDPDRLGLLPQSIEQATIDLLVDDTVLPAAGDDDAVRRQLRRALVMRRTLPARHDALLAHPALPQVQTIVIPHHTEEFGYPLPATIATRTLFAGPIVRRPDLETTLRLRDKYQLGDGDFTLLSTVGGGGFPDELPRFWAVVAAVHDQLAATTPRLRHLVVAGPHEPRRAPVLANLSLLVDEPDLVSLFPLVQAVISAAGYNTIHELRLTHTPAFLLPAERRHDDQFERAERLAATGAALSFRAETAAEIGAQIVHRLSSPAALIAMRLASQQNPLDLGNRRAAAALLAAVSA